MSGVVRSGHQLIAFAQPLRSLAEPCRQGVREGGQFVVSSA